MNVPFEIANEVEQLSMRIADRKAQKEFARGFEEALKQSQTSSHDIPVHEHLKKGLLDAYNFGKSLGFFVGTLRFHPRKVIKSNEDASHFLQSLKSLSEHAGFHEFAGEKFSKWSKRVRPHFKELEEAEKRAYMFLLRML